MSLIPLCIDLDGTLIDEDVTLKAVKIYIRRSFFNLIMALAWIIRGRAYLKHRIAQCVDLDAKSLNYRKKLLAFIREKKKKGHRIFLATACNQIYAGSISDYLGIFDGVFASTERENLRAEAKAQALIRAFGRKGFSYAGNSNDDVCIWRESAECILVTPTKSVLKKMQGCEYLLFEK
ncbi:MAG: haloacid dehalogenase-like hydrolase [Holosporaceae bacterium]|jgi:phosphoserine phosphatase|nr:haloacid dehalogenase-like hydrolase [Holosporaceae bacterium]